MGLKELAARMSRKSTFQGEGTAGAKAWRQWVCYVGEVASIKLLQHEGGEVRSERKLGFCRPL